MKLWQFAGHEVAHYCFSAHIMVLSGGYDQIVTKSPSGFDVGRMKVLVGQTSPLLPSSGRPQPHNTKMVYWQQGRQMGASQFTNCITGVGAILYYVTMEILHIRLASPRCASLLPQIEWLPPMPWGARTSGGVTPGNQQQN